MFDHNFTFTKPVTINVGCDCTHKPRRGRLAVVGFEVNNKPQRKNTTVLNVSLRTNQYAIVTFAPVDADNKPVKIENLEANVTNGTAVATVLDDGRVQIVPADDAGESTIEVSADGQPGDAVEILTEEITLSAIAPNAVNLGASVEIRQKSELPQQP